MKKLICEEEMKEETKKKKMKKSTCESSEEEESIKFTIWARHALKGCMNDDDFLMQMWLKPWNFYNSAQNFHSSCYKKLCYTKINLFQIFCDYELQDAQGTPGKWNFDDT